MLLGCNKQPENIKSYFLLPFTTPNKIMLISYVTEARYFNVALRAILKIELDFCQN